MPPGQAAERSPQVLSSLTGHRAVRPPPHSAAEAVPAALPVLQRPTAGPGAIPLTDRCLLQQLSEQEHPGAGDELCAAGHLHPGTSRTGTVQLTW